MSLSPTLRTVMMDGMSHSESNRSDTNWITLTEWDRPQRLMRGYATHQCFYITTEALPTPKSPSRAPTDPTEPQQSPCQHSPYRQSHYRALSGLQQTPYLPQQSPYQQSPYQQSPYQQSPYRQSPYKTLSELQQRPYRPRQSPYQQSPYRQSPYTAPIESLQSPCWPQQSPTDPLPTHSRALTKLQQSRCQPPVWPPQSPYETEFLQDPTEWRERLQ